MGAVDNYFYRHMAGVNSDPETSGFQNIVFRPNFIKTMDFAKASYNSIYGEVKAEWTKVINGIYEYKEVVPANCEAQVVLPGKTVKVKVGAHTFTIK